MTQEQKRRAIGEAHGYKKVECPLSSLGGGSPVRPEPMTYWAEECWGGDSIGLPDYFSDLNACHEMEKVLKTPQQTGTFLRLLDAICNPEPRLQEGFYVIHATAAQRCEAFGLTLGLWKQTLP